MVAEDRHVHAILRVQVGCKQKDQHECRCWSSVFRRYFCGAMLCHHSAVITTPAEYPKMVDLEHVKVRVDLRGSHGELYFSYLLVQWQIRDCVAFVAFYSHQDRDGLCPQITESSLLSLRVIFPSYLTMTDRRKT